MAHYISDITFLSGNDSNLDTNDIIVWKSDVTDFKTGSVLTVGESQEALFYLNGECVGVLTAGRHILETDNIPFLRRLINWVTGNKNIFHAEIYYVNKVETPVKWGAGELVYHDPAGPVFKLGAHGEVNLKVLNSRMLVEKLSGVEKILTKETLVERFRGIISSEVMDTLLHKISEEAVSVIDLSLHLKTLSGTLQDTVSEIFSKYGFSASQFRIVGIKMPEEDEDYIRLKKIRADQKLKITEAELEQQTELIRQQTEAKKIEMEAQALAKKRALEGYTYQQEKQFDILQNAVQNGGSETGGLAGDVMGIGIGLGAMGNVAQIMQNQMGGAMAGFMSSVQTPGNEAGMPYGQAPSGAGIPPYGQTPKADGAGRETQRRCDNCGAVLKENAKFCIECGAKVEEPEKKVCPQCGHEAENCKFCPQCGTRLE